PNDFVLAPDRYETRRDVVFAGIDTVRKLWRGEEVVRVNGQGREVPVRVYPRPYQSEIATWITCSGGIERFQDAGRLGAHVLTALLFQTPDELGEKIRAYRQARAEAGLDPATGQVTLMLHTYLGEDLEEVRDLVRGPFIRYLESSVDLWRHGSRDLAELSEKERAAVLDTAFERYFRTSALIGTPDTCADMLDRLAGLGVNEIACLIDFGLDADAVLDSLQLLDEVRRRHAPPERTDASKDGNGR